MDKKKVHLFLPCSESLSVQIEVGTRLSEAPTESAPAREIERRYATRETKQRLHQSAFREMVLEAYKERCAFSGLPVRRLLQAAHIVADSEAEGIAAVRNGIALSTLHHAAFDAQLAPELNEETVTDRDNAVFSRLSLSTYFPS